MSPTAPGGAERGTPATAPQPAPRTTPESGQQQLHPQQVGADPANPLIFQPWGDAYLMVTSKGGMPEPPAWSRNLEMPSQPDMPVPVDASHSGDRHRPTSALRTGPKSSLGRLGILAVNAAYITIITMTLVTLLSCAPPRQAAAETGFPGTVVGSDPVRTTDPAESVGSTGMTKADEPVREHVQETTAVYDHGQFYLYTDVWDEIDPVQIVHDAINTDGVAQGGPLLVVLSPHQCNFAVALRVERWSAQPAGDLDAWQEAFSASIDVNEFGLLYESTTTIQNLRLEVPAGRYTALITGRGFVHRGWPGSTKPGDEWRVQLWPRDGAHRDPARLKAWAG